MPPKVAAATLRGSRRARYGSLLNRCGLRLRYRLELNDLTAADASTARIRGAAIDRAAVGSDGKSSMCGSCCTRRR